MPKTRPPAPAIDPRYASFRLEVRGSAIHRWGVYAGEDIPPGRKIIEYAGARLNRVQAKRRAESKLHYLFTVNPYWCVDGSTGGSGAEFINHSCDPNIYAWVLKGHILFMCKRAIRKGEELTIDYHFAKDVERVVCSCGSAKCRGTINLK